jgi:tRNA-Thr(GGU) m(6)t(6)A37 methyltransferase TsaA
MSKLEMQVIGHVQSCYPDKFGTPRQPGLTPLAKGFLKISAAFQPTQSLQELESFSHVWVIFYFHKNNRSRFHSKVHPPRLEGRTVGVFASRSPHRPNPIGLSLLEIEKVEADGIWVRGLDVIDGTPILDIKPYLKEIESKPEARSGWTEGLETRIFEIEWSPESLETLRLYEDGIGPIRDLIEQTLSQDPRPLVYKGDTDNPSPYRDTHAVRIYDLDIHFRYLTDFNLRIEKIKTQHEAR